MNHGFMRPYTEAELSQMGINFKLWELCKYQYSIVEKYREYIEKELHQKIREEIVQQPDLNSQDWCVYKHIDIPQTRLVARCDPSVFRSWELLQMEYPLVTPEYFINIAYKEQKEREDANSN